MAKPKYKGFSSFEFEKRKSFTLTDIELIKMDLLNHIFTRRGERVMMPTFGTSVPDLTFEQLTPELADLVEEEIFQVIEYDPRVNLLSIETRPNYDSNALTVAVNVAYVELGVVGDFELNISFEN